MGKFAKASTQAASVTRAMQMSGHLKSLGTIRDYTQALTRVCEFVKENRLGSLRDITPELAVCHLEIRSEEVGQKQLDMERQAVQAMMHHLTGKLPQCDRLTVVKSAHQQILVSRSYTPDQVALVANAQQSQNSLSTRIAYAAGLRAHELLTLRKSDERPADVRPAADTKFRGREGEIYTVKGKGGLVREVILPSNLAKQLEGKRLETYRMVSDREIYYRQYYDINGGQKWASSFTQASSRTLGWTTGAHGLRHSYAQERIHELQCSCLDRHTALLTVSQELGHFRPEITEVYLR